jgi:hypothetical protein
MDGLRSGGSDVVEDDGGLVLGGTGRRRLFRDPAWREDPGRTLCAD